MDKKMLTEESSTVGECNYCGNDLDPEFHIGKGSCSWDCASWYDEENHNVDTNKKVKKASDELKEELQKWSVESGELGKSLLSKAQNLVNALEEQKEEPEELKNFHDNCFSARYGYKKEIKYADCGCNQDIESCPDCKPRKQEPKSIWKPISELQKDTPTCQILYKEDGQIRSGVFKYFIDDDIIIESFWEGEPQVLSYLDDIKEFCTLTDFINQQTSNEERIIKLENK